MHSTTQHHREALQRQTQQDWANREYVQLMAGSITRISDFLNTFSQSCSGRLANLDSRLTGLERKVTFLENKIGYTDVTNPSTRPESDEEEDDQDGERF